MQDHNYSIHRQDAYGQQPVFIPCITYFLVPLLGATHILRTPCVFRPYLGCCIGVLQVMRNDLGAVDTPKGVSELET